MIQRIQTLYLIVADLLMALLFFVPFSEMVGKDGSLYSFGLSGLVSEGPAGGKIDEGAWLLFILACLILGTNSLIIFLFKNRVLQMRLSTIVVFLLLGLTLFSYISIYRSNDILGGGYSLKIYLAFPLIAAIFVYLAIRGMVKDERLVKSIDRIR
ncbi:MAG: DUF4293 domain-containing protein [Bacteroidetes bacterium]|nr:DUF4293 domain-containing protein [Bacteroidota bacterium]